MNNKDKNYDVIIVGAGVAGLMLANFLNNSSKKVLLVEKRKTITELSNSIFGLNRESIEKFGLNDIIIREYDKFAIGGRRVKDWFFYKHKSRPFVVVDFNKFAKNFKPNCKVHTNFKVTKARHLKNGISISDVNGHSYFGKIVVDCSGSAEIISKQLGFKNKKTTYDFYNISYELENCNFPDKIVDLPSFPFVGFKYSNLPLWIYPYSNSKCQLGKAEIVSKKFPLVKNDKDYLPYIMKNIKPYSTWFKNARITRKVEGLARQTISRPMVSDNFLSCGNAAGATTPLLGEGSRIAIEMAFLASTTIAKSFDFNNFSKNFLKEYEKNFNNLFGKYYFKSNVMKFIWLRYFTDKEFSLLIQNLEKWSESEYIRFYRSEFSWKMLFKILSGKLPFLILKNIVIYHIINRNKILTKKSLD